MKEYIVQNKYKWLRTFVFSSIVMTGLFGGWVYFRCSQGICYERSEILKFLFVPFAALPALMIPVELARGFADFKRTEKFFASHPLTDFFQNGFVRSWSHTDSKWVLSKLIFTGTFEKHEMIFSTGNGFLTIVAKADYDHLDDWQPGEVKAVVDAFPNMKFSYDADGIATSLKISDVKSMSYENFRTYINEFDEMLGKLQAKDEAKHPGK